MGFNKDFKVLVYRRRGKKGKANASLTRNLYWVQAFSSTPASTTAWIDKSSRNGRKRSHFVNNSGMSRALDRVKPTGASWYVCAKAGGLRRLQALTGAAVGLTSGVTGGGACSIPGELEGEGEGESWETAQRAVINQQAGSKGS